MNELYQDPLQHDERNVLDALNNFEAALKAAGDVNAALRIHYRLDALYHRIDRLAGEAMLRADALCVANQSEVA